MGIRKIEDEIDLKEAMRKRAAELRIKEIQAKASTENLTKDRIKELAKRHGVILALTPELKNEVKMLQEKYNISSSKIITEQITEHEVLRKFSKIDHEKLGMLAYQRVLMQKEEIGVGLLPISEVFELINTGILKGNTEIKDVIKAMKLLEKNKVIEDVKKLDSGAIMIQFFPIQYTDDQVKVIELAKQKDFLTIESICLEFSWSQDRTMKVIKTLEDSGIAKFRESILTGKQWFFPSI